MSAAVGQPREPAGPTMRRIAVRGSSGSGKSRLAAALATARGLRHVELDAFYHQPGWQAAEPAAFRAAVDEATRGDGWVVDGNYREVQDLVLARADTVVWLDLPRRLVMRRLVTRTLTRGLLRRPLWNGNRESAMGVLRRDPDRNLVLWAWQHFDQRHAEAVAAPDDPDLAHAHVVRLCAPDEVADFLDAVARDR